MHVLHACAKQQWQVRPKHHSESAVACSASADEQEEFERRTLELSSLATLSGVPQVKPHLLLQWVLTA